MASATSSSTSGASPESEVERGSRSSRRSEKPGLEVDQERRDRRRPADLDGLGTVGHVQGRIPGARSGLADLVPRRTVRSGAPGAHRQPGADHRRRERGHRLLGSVRIPLRGHPDPLRHRHRAHGGPTGLPIRRGTCHGENHRQAHTARPERDVRRLRARVLGASIVGVRGQRPGPPPPPRGQGAISTGHFERPALGGVHGARTCGFGVRRGSRLRRPHHRRRSRTLPGPAAPDGHGEAALPPTGPRRARLQRAVARGGGPEPRDPGLRCQHSDRTASRSPRLARRSHLSTVPS